MSGVGKYIHIKYVYHYEHEKHLYFISYNTILTITHNKCATALRLLVVLCIFDGNYMPLC